MPPLQNALAFSRRTGNRQTLTDGQPYVQIDNPAGDKRICSFIAPEDGVLESVNFFIGYIGGTMPNPTHWIEFKAINKGANGTGTVNMLVPNDTKTVKPPVGPMFSIRGNHLANKVQAGDKIVIVGTITGSGGNWDFQGITATAVFT